MNRVARTFLDLVRIEVLLGLGLVFWVASMEAFASLPASRLHKDYQGIWLVEDTSRKEQFVLRLRGGNYTETMFTLAGRYVGNEVRGQSLKIRSTKERNLLLTSRLGEEVMTGKLISPTEMAGVFSDGSKWTATKTDNPQQRIVWQLVKKNRRQCGSFFKRALEPSCEETGGVGTQGAEYVNWSFPTTFKTEAVCQVYANTYWLTVCPDKEGATCTWGNCENGVGRFEYESGNYSVAQYKDGRRDGYGIWRKADATIECEGTNKLGKRNGLWVCRYLLSTTNSYATYFTYYAEGENQYSSDTALYLNDAGRVIAYDSATGNPSRDYDRLAQDYSALTDISLGQLRLNLSKEFRQIGFPTKESFISYLGRSASNDNSRSANASEPLPQPSTAEKTETEARTEPVGCNFGDCEDGFGSYRFDNGDEYTGYFKNSLEDGYGIFVEPLESGEKRECEGLYSNGYTAGLQVCRSSGTSLAEAYYHSNEGKANGRGVMWHADWGAILLLPLWRDGKYVRDEAADLAKMSADWEAIKASPQAVMRASLLSDEFLALKLPTADEQSDWLRKRELRLAEKTQSIPKEKPVSLGCISGDCDDGFGEFATSRVTYIGRFRGGRVSGYTLVTSSGDQCEAQMSGGLHAGLEHCVNLETGNHTYAYRSRAGYDGAKITVSQTGKLVAYEVFREGSKVDVSFSTEADKEKLAALELRGLLDELNILKRTAPPESRNFRVAPLNRLPEVEFGPREPVKPQRPQPQIQPKPAQETKAISEPKPAPAAKPAPKPLPAVEPKPAPLPEQATTAPLAAPAPKPTASVVITPAEPKKPPRDLQRLAYIVAELNANRRQINYNYRLDRVRIDSKKFELVYEFFATKPIKELNTSVITQANKTAYCSSAKLQPFRDENMPARWSYVDSEEEAFEVVTKVSDCR